MLELLKANSGAAQEISLTNSSEEWLREKLPQELLKRAAPLFRASTQDELTALSGTESHQGIVLRRSAREDLTVQSLVSLLEGIEGPGIVLAFDGITDPQNTGALLRAAECFSALAVLWSKNRSPGITPVVTKTSAGAAELIPTAPVSNLSDALSKLKKVGFWTVAAGRGEGAAPLHEFSFPERTVLILGAEGGGISEKVLKGADFQVWISTSGSLDSLNVSQAGAVLLHHYRVQHEAGVS